MVLRICLENYHRIGLDKWNDTGLWRSRDIENIDYSNCAEYASVLSQYVIAYKCADR